MKYKVSVGEINRGIQGKYKVRDHYFSLEKSEIFRIPKKVIIRNKEIYLYDKNGNLFKKFPNPNECVKAFGLNNSSEISSAIRLGRAFKGYHITTRPI